MWFGNFPQVFERSYASEDRGTLTLAELERWLALQIAGVYHLSVHSALGKAPLAAWQEGTMFGIPTTSLLRWQLSSTACSNGESIASF
jgi:hypothetical protein